jgi:MoaA/NifB/PqqE/SkfB family radical SAM enzyme
MFEFRNLKQIHLEISNNCQASCPMCSRNIHGGLENPLIKVSNWTIDEYKTIISEDVINQVQQIYFCGNFGDPLLNNDLLEMIRYTAEVNSDINLRVHTNGSLRSKDWWKELAVTLPKEHMVIFAIDGLEDTHSIYRIGTEYNKIIENAKAFISQGGRANWTFIKFKHNEHQVEEANRIANDLGFKEFTVKNSSRFINESKHKVVDIKGITKYHLEPSSDSGLTFINKEIIDNAEQLTKESEIFCFADSIKEIYIDVYKNLMPCCWLASVPFNYIDVNDYAAPVRQKMLEQYNELVYNLGGGDNLNVLKKSIRQIIDSAEYQTVWKKSWDEHKLMTCARFCGKFKQTNISKPKDQFVDNKKLS